MGITILATLTVTSTGTGSGTVTSSHGGIDCGTDCSQDYSYRTSVTLTAIPNTGSYFAGWSGDPDCADGIVTMNANKTCIAIFMGIDCSQGTVFNVSNPTELQDALNIAASNGQADTINVAAGTYNITATLTYNAAETENYPLCITGAGAGTTILDGGESGVQILNINTKGVISDDSAHISIRGITFKKGKKNYGDGGGLAVTTNYANITVQDSEFSNNTSYYPEFGGGGAYISPGGTITIYNNTISNNTASEAGALYSWVFGGGIYTSGGTIFISRNTITNNTVYTSDLGAVGGGIYASGTVTIYNNTISNNTVRSEYSGPGGIYTAKGGGIYTGGTVTIYNNTISNNTAADGSGIYTYGGTATIHDNIIINNIGVCKYVYGGGIYAFGIATIYDNIISSNTISGAYSAYGGGIYASGEVTISNNSIVRNSAQNAGGVSYNGGTDIDFKFNTITGNVATGASPTYATIINGNPLFNYNNIFGNTATYELWNANPAGSPDINAEYAWWGTLNPPDVVYDCDDDATKGCVDYTPWESLIRTDAPISPPTGLTATTGIRFNHIKLVTQS